MKTVHDINLTNKWVIHRVAFDVPLRKNQELKAKSQKPNWEVVDDLRIKVIFPTLFYLLNKNCRVILMSYLGRPKKRDKTLSLAPVATRLSELIARPAKFLPNLLSKKTRKVIKEMKEGEIVLLENTRFYPVEYQDDEHFAKELASLGQIFVQDAFAQCHRKHASITGIPRHLSAVAGLYLEKEVKALKKLLDRVKKPFVIIIGGIKVADKVPAIVNLVKKADKVLLGGAAANVFLQARGVLIDHSIVEESLIEGGGKDKEGLISAAFSLLKNPKVVLPKDLWAVDNLKKPKKKKLIFLDHKIPTNWAFVDLGPKTLRLYKEIIGKAKTCFWCGPVGMFENEEFAEGSKRIAKAVAAKKISIVSGGDTVKAVRNFGLFDQFEHVSVAGGATLEFLAGKKLPGLEVLEK